MDPKNSNNSLKISAFSTKKNDTHLVSVVIPTYNRSNLLVECIKNCLRQTYRNLEIIVVDDGSTDNTNEVVKAIQKKDARVIYHHKDNEGLPYALNFGFKIAKGDYLTWTSDDNLYRKDAIETMLNFIIERNVSFIYCDYYRYRKMPNTARRLVALPDFNQEMTYNYFGPCFLYTKEVAEVIGDYDPITKYAEDFDYWIRISKNFRVSHLKEPLYFYLEHGDSLSERKALEIMVVTVLVRIKNRILGINNAVKTCIEIKSRSNWRFGQASSKLTFFPLKIFSQLYYWWIKINFSRKIYEILKNYELKNESFTNTKSQLIKLLQTN
jgi:glycosyltransferase involved in cell wall biosynthesis